MKTFSSITKKTSRRNSPKRSRIVRGLTLSVIALIVLAAFDEPAGMIASLVGSPVKHMERWVNESSSALPTYIRDRASILERQRELERELAAVTGDRASASRLSRENEELRSLLSAGTHERIAAGVIMRPNETPYDTLLIDRGSRDGIQKHAAVFGPDDVVLGTIAKVYPESALVTLVTTPGTVSTAYIYGPDIYTEAIGQGGGVLQVGVSQGVEINKGNLVVMPSIDPGIFGTISHVESSESSPEQYGYVTSPLSMREIRLVSVSAKPVPEVSFEAAQQVVEDTRSDLLRVDVPDDILVSTSTATSTGTTTPE